MYWTSFIVVVVLTTYWEYDHTSLFSDGIKTVANYVRRTLMEVAPEMSSRDASIVVGRILQCTARTQVCIFLLLLLVLVLVLLLVVVVVLLPLLLLLFCLLSCFFLTFSNLFILYVSHHWKEWWCILRYPPTCFCLFSWVRLNFFFEFFFS